MNGQGGLTQVDLQFNQSCQKELYHITDGQNKEWTKVEDG